MIKEKYIPGFEGLYKVNNRGDVFSLSRLDVDGRRRLSFRKLKPLNQQGYNVVCLFKNKKVTRVGVHRLVAICFIDNPDQKPCVNHLDGIRNNNNVKNLEWVTFKENAQHAHDTGLQKGLRNEKHYRSKPLLQIDKYGNLVKRWPSLPEIKRQLNIDFTSISKCANGQRKSAHGYKWVFENE